ncbi:hypothetical protein BBJ28_00011415 [Nothophytophthora sp. Chile5]|nr:hypothetical protein BBJ28_00011415 [Nothophytophthora sp. Chile5]
MLPHLITHREEDEPTAEDMAPGGRVRKELEECQRDPQLSGVMAAPVSDASLQELRGAFFRLQSGPPATPYEGGVFELEIVIPPKYPFEPPQMRFITKIWHPNISSQTGAICLDQWSPALTIKTALLSIQALLSAAEPTDPQDAEVAKMYLHDQEQFLNTARFWTESYAKQRETGDAAALSRLTDMGFSAVRCSALAPVCWHGDALTELVLLFGWPGTGQGRATGLRWRRERRHREAGQQHVAPAVPSCWSEVVDDLPNV